MSVCFINGAAPCRIEFQKVQECDARGGDSSNIVWQQKIYFYCTGLILNLIWSTFTLTQFKIRLHTQINRL